MKRIAIIAAAACIALTGCSKEDPAAPQSGGPIRFSAAMDDRPQGFSRATTDNGWSGGEQIAVSIRGEVKKYVADAQGTLTAAVEIPFFWQGEQEQVRAWCFGTYLPAEPERITVQADQSAGYAASDFLFASATIAKSNPTLTFAHQTVKVVLHVKADGRDVQRLALGDGNLALTGAWNKTEERIEPAQGGTGTVTPLAEKAAAGFDASYSALLVPQEMGGKAFIRVTVDGLEYTHTPKAGDAVLEGGKRYVYKVTVRDAITVEPVEAGYWIDDGSEDVSYYELKAGDYLYADGTWSDGGLRTRHPDGRLEWATPKPSPIAGKKVIGIVFQTDPSRISAAEKALFAEKGKTLHGLAMSLKCRSYSKWYDNYSLSSPDNYTCDESIEDPAFEGYFLPNIYDRDFRQSYANADADINGYFNTEVIRVRRAADLEAGYYQAFKTAVDFAEQYGGPDADVFTTGWYLPSVGQWLDFFRNIGGLKLGPENLAEVLGDFLWLNTGNVGAALNGAMEAIPDEDKSTYGLSGNRFWTSSAVSSQKVFTINFVFNDKVSSLACPWGWKNNQYQNVRCAIAF